jgi:hypothetical protein
MKKLFLVPLALLATTASLMAQLKVLNNGLVGIYLTAGENPHARLTISSSQDYINQRVNLYTRNFFNFGYGDANKFMVNQYSTRALVVYSFIDGQQKWLVDGAGNSTQQGSGWFGGQVYAFGNPIWSDKSLKKNIKGCSNALDKILSLRGTNYTMIESFDTYQTTCGYNLDEDNQNASSTTLPGFKAKENKLETRITKQTVKIKDNDKLQYGFIAQEVQKVLPELVKVDERSGLLTINYVQVIPILVEAFKTQNATIDALKAQNLKLAARIAKLEKGKTSTSNARTEAETPDTQTDTKTTSNVSDLVKTAYLYQNTPNPFSQETQIRYYVPETNANTFVSVTDLSGKQIKLLPITTQGEGFVSIKANELYAGLFIYTLVVDGNIIDSKRMMVVE